MAAIGHIRHWLLYSLQDHHENEMKEMEGKEGRKLEMKSFIREPGEENGSSGVKMQWEQVSKQR